MVPRYYPQLPIWVAQDRGREPSSHAVWSRDSAAVAAGCQNDASGAEPGARRRKLAWDWGACRVPEEAAEAEAEAEAAEAEAATAAAAEAEAEAAAAEAVAEAEAEEDAELVEELMQRSAGQDIGKSQSKRNRLTPAQVRALQGSFDSRRLLAPQQKLRLARDLGLHPRQVAVWFQNHRARSKVKLLHRRFSVLRSDYDALVAETHSLRSEVGVYIMCYICIDRRESGRDCIRRSVFNYGLGFRV
jgi:hypothetical protein